jgi:alpha-beta hydrolase superfamily lysophospholipase
MLKKSIRLALRVAIYIVSSFLLVGLTLLIGHAVMVRNGPDLDWWHTQEISSEFVESDKDDIQTLQQYLDNETKVFEELEQLEAQNLPEGYEHQLNRYRQGSDSYPVKNGQNFNRSYQLIPEDIKGGVLLLHGLTDSPYSLRHLGELFERQGLYVLSLRMPGHGTIPGELNRMQWQDWQAATELGARHVAGVIGDQQPFYIAGYSNGGSLALKYTLDAISSEDMRVPDQLFLLSPMIAVDRLAKYSSIFIWLGDVDFFNKSRWMDVLPEYDPHKYNSFPVNAALQSYKFTSAIRAQIGKMHSKGELQKMPPVLTFQSLVDKTVVASALFDELYESLPVNNSELVLFDVNTIGELNEFLRPHHHVLLDRIKNDGSGQYALSIIENEGPRSQTVSELRKAAGQENFVRRDLPYNWPRQAYSLTHVAIPFPLDDEIYGLESLEMRSDFPHLGRVQLLGEEGALILPPGLMQRLRSNPFYGYIESKVTEVVEKDQSRY